MARASNAAVIFRPLRLPRLLLLAPLLLAGCGNAAAEAEPVRTLLADTSPDGPVVDEAGLIPADAEAELDTGLREFFNQSGAALVVVTVNSLQGQSIEQAAHDTFGTLGIGDRQTHRGLLIFVAPADHSARIEVGCGLEATITDDVANTIMQDNIMPRFREADFVGGINSGADELMAAVNAGGTAQPVSASCRQIMGVAG